MCVIFILTTFAYSTRHMSYRFSQSYLLERAPYYTDISELVEGAAVEPVRCRIISRSTPYSPEGWIDTDSTPTPMPEKNAEMPIDWNMRRVRRHLMHDKEVEHSGFYLNHSNTPPLMMATINHWIGINQNNQYFDIVYLYRSRQWVGVIRQTGEMLTHKETEIFLNLHSLHACKFNGSDWEKAYGKGRI